MSVGKTAMQGRNLGGDLTGFLALEGADYKYGSGLMVVGRSVNGWTKGIDPVEFSDSDFRNNYTHCLQQKSYQQSGQACPMSWVTEQWSPKEGYNTRKSAFWRVTKEVTERLYSCNAEKNDWASHLVWSNLCKVSPAAGKNPNGLLHKIQRNGCKRLFEFEIKSYRPRYLLLLTGWDWARPFLVENFEINPGSGKYVSCVAKPAKPLFPNCHDVRAVVAVHPQCKPEKEWVDEVFGSFTL